MASTSEFEQQQFWVDKPIDIRIKHKHLYDIITYRLEESLHQTMIKQTNKTYLPKEYYENKK
jgi:hypothetical protein